MTADQKVIGNAMRAVGRTFMGGALDNLEGAPMGKGHGNDGKPFDIETACYMKPKFAEYDKARRNGTRLKLVDLSGVKTMKSFALEVCAAEHVCNGDGDVAIFFGSENAAETTATTRILNFYKGNDQGGGIPRFKKKVETMTSRFDETNGAQKFPDKTLFVLSANLGNCAQKNLAFIGLQDGYVLQRTGMIKEMLPRTTAYEKDCIIYLESQGGEKGYDFDNEYEDTDQRELHTVCQHCAKNHIFNWKAFDEESMRRPDDFVPTPPQIIPSLDHAAWIAHNQPLLKGKVAGFQRGDDALIKHKNGNYNEAAILRETYFECYFCGGRWDDDGRYGKTRIWLDEKSNYVASRLDALPGNVGFNTPQWINRRLSWGKIMLEKLLAHRVANELGNFNDLKVWWQKVAARTWDMKLTGRPPERPGATIYDIDGAKKMPGEKVRISATDIQHKMTHMVYLAVAVGDGTPPWVLHYEWVKPPVGLPDVQAAEFCKNRVRALDKQFGIQPHNSMKDCAHEPGLVREWAAEDAVWGKTHQKERPHWISYGLLIGDERASYKWTHPGRPDTWERFKQFQEYKVPCVNNGKRALVNVHTRLWSNPSIKDIAERWLLGFSAPKIQINEKFLADTSKDGLWMQLTSEEKLPWKGNPNKLVYQKKRPENHGWDALCMIFVRMDELGLLNSFAPPPKDDVDEN